jgi:dinuclear metal center YbgI/SA1388 family protein
MTTLIQHVCQSLAELAPLHLAESWDNVGLLLGDRHAAVHRVMVCLTITPAVVREAIDREAELIISHHPLPFKPLARITRDSVAGAMLLDLIRGGVAVYSAHTAWDSAVDGINQQLADSLKLDSVAPLMPLEHAAEAPEGSSEDPPAMPQGAGRYGRAAAGTTLSRIAQVVSRKTSASATRLVGSADKLVHKVALACGSGGSFLDAAARCGCDVLVTGEATFQTCLDAEARGIALVLLGHYASERFAMEELAGRLAAVHDDLSIWASLADRDPIHAI